jgi:hypothetical protein
MHPGQYAAISEFLLDRYTNVPTLYYGASGIGKTQIIEDLCKKRGIPFVYFNATGMEPADLIGLPYKAEIEMPYATIENGKDVIKQRMVTVMRHMPPIKLAQVEGAPKGVICIDEVNRLEQQVRHTVMQFLDRRELGEVNLPPGWLIVLTANPSDSDYQVDELDIALRRRCMVFKLEFDLNMWIEWATTDYRSPVIDPHTGQPVGTALSARIIAAVRRTAKAFRWDIENEIPQKPTAFGAKVCSELYHAGAMEHFDAEMSTILFGGVVGPEVGQAIVKSLSDEKIQAMLEKAMKGEKFEATHDVMIDLLDLFWEKVSASPKKYGPQIMNFYKCLGQDIRAVLVKRIYPFFSKKEYIADPNFQELAKEWREWCVKMMYKLKGLRAPGQTV